MSKRKLIYVQALYDYDGDFILEHSLESREPLGEAIASLSFKAGDTIQVLTRLPSGWWDGICHGKRGWFPSNFVSSPSIAFSSSTMEKKNPDETPEDLDQSLPNTIITSTTSSSRDSALFSPISSAESEDNDPSASARGRILFSKMRTLSISSHRDSIGLGLVRLDSQKRERALSESSSTPGSHQPLSPVDSITSDFSVNVELPPHWGVKTTFSGRPYYYHTLTNATRWDLEGVNPITGEDTTSAPQASSLYHSFNTLPVLPAKPTNDQDWSWDSLFGNIKEINACLEAHVRIGKKEHYVTIASTMVESIRIMLYASGTSSSSTDRSKSSPTKHKHLKHHHRNILNTLSKLILAAKMASSIWPPPDASETLIIIAEEVIQAVALFVISARETGVVISPATQTSSMAGTMMDDQGEEEEETRPSHAALICSLESSMKTILSLIERIDSPDESLAHSVLSQNTSSFMTPNPILDLPHHPITAATLISRVRSIVSSVGTFLSLVDDAPLDSVASLSDDLTVDFKVNRLALYNAISSLVMTIQTATSTGTDASNAVGHVFGALSLVEKAVKDVLICVKYLVEEREVMEQVTLQTYIEQYGMQKQSTPSTVAISASAPGVIEETGDNTFTTHGSRVSQGHEHEQYLRSSHPTGPRSPSRASRPYNLASDDEDSRPLYDSLQQTYAPNAESPFGLRSIPESTPPASLSSSYERKQMVSAQDGPRHSSDSADGKSFNLKLSRLSKIQKILGSEVSAYSPLDSPEKDEFWFLSHDFVNGELLYTMEGQLRAGTLRALIEKLTLHDSLDANFTLRFLLTYRSFTSSSEFLFYLKERFFLPPPEGLLPHELDLWQEKKQTPIRIRVFNVLKSWVEHHLQNGVSDTTGDRDTLFEIKKFAEEAKAWKMSFAAGQLLKIVDRKLGVDGGSGVKVTVAVPKQCPLPILPKGSSTNGGQRSYRIFDIDPLEIARQFTLMESHIFAMIQPVEFLGKSWSLKHDDDDKSSMSPNVKKMISMSNQITSWATYCILSEKDVRRRAKLVSFFISVADKCSSLNNFNCLMAILASLNSAPVHRLKRTWDLVNTKAMNVLNNLRTLMSSTKNFINYRQTLHSLNPPCVPFLGFYLTDLTFIEEGNPTFLPGNIVNKSPSKRYLKNLSPMLEEDTQIDATLTTAAETATLVASTPNNDHLINFAKMSKMADVIREVQQFQHVPYALASVQEIQDTLWQSMASSPDENALYDISLVLEPKDKDGASSEYRRLKVLLTDSGLL